LLFFPTVFLNISIRTLPKVDGVPKDVRDVGISKRRKDMDIFNLPCAFIYLLNPLADFPCVVLGSFRLGGREQTNLLTSYAPWSGIGTQWVSPQKHTSGFL
jgi:hypothetical protein